MRERDYSLARAAREAGTTPGTVLHHVGRQGLRKTSSGRYVPTKSDSLYRRMWVTHIDGAGYGISVAAARRVSWPA